jgi:hypothetical protein
VVALAFDASLAAPQPVAYPEPIGSPAPASQSSPYALAPRRSLLAPRLDRSARSRVVLGGSELAGGGPGKLRYGGIATDDGGFERVTRFAIAQLALEPSVELPYGWRARAQVNWDGRRRRPRQTPAPITIRCASSRATLWRAWPGEDGGMGVLVGFPTRRSPLEQPRLGADAAPVAHARRR